MANGVQIPNLGERKFHGVTAERSMKSVVAQVCQANSGLLSVRKVTSVGNRVVFDEDGSYYQNKMSGEVTRIKEVGCMYELTMCVSVRRVFSSKAGCRRSKEHAIDTAVKQRPARPVSLNPLRTGQAADKMMDENHSMKDEAAEVEDIEDQEDQRGVEGEEPTLENLFGSFVEHEPRVHDGGLGQDVVPVEGEPAHGSLDTEERGSAQGGCANLSCPAKESATNMFRTVTRATCVSEQGGAKAAHRQRSQGEKEEHDQFLRVSMDLFYMNEKDRAEDANPLDEETGDKHSRVVEEKGLGRIGEM